MLVICLINTLDYMWQQSDMKLYIDKYSWATQTINQYDTFSPFSGS